MALWIWSNLEEDYFSFPWAILLSHVLSELTLSKIFQQIQKEKSGFLWCLRNENHKQAVGLYFWRKTAGVRFLWGDKSILLFIQFLWSGLQLGISLPIGKWSWIIYTYHSIVNEYWRSLAKEGYEYVKALWIQIKNSWLSKSSICW